MQFKKIWFSIVFMLVMLSTTAHSQFVGLPKQQGSKAVLSLGYLRTGTRWMGMNNTPVSWARLGAEFNLLDSTRVSSISDLAVHPDNPNNLEIIESLQILHLVRLGPPSQLPRRLHGFVLGGGGLMTSSSTSDGVTYNAAHVNGSAGFLLNTEHQIKLFTGLAYHRVFLTGSTTYGYYTFFSGTEVDVSPHISTLGNLEVGYKPESKNGWVALFIGIRFH